MFLAVLYLAQGLFRVKASGWKVQVLGFGLRVKVLCVNGVRFEGYTVVLLGVVVVDTQAEEAVEQREIHLLVHLLELRLDYYVRLAYVAVQRFGRRLQG